MAVDMQARKKMTPRRTAAQNFAASNAQRTPSLSSGREIAALSCRTLDAAAVEAEDHQGFSCLRAPKV